LEIRINEPLLAYFNPLAGGGLDKVPFRLEWTEVHLTNHLDDVGVVLGRDVGAGNVTFSGKSTPRHESVELLFVGYVSVLVWANIRAAEDRGHDESHGKTVSVVLCKKEDRKSVYKR
jgi:hypothetical protein